MNVVVRMSIVQNPYEFVFHALLLALCYFPAKECAQHFTTMWKAFWRQTQSETGQNYWWNLARGILNGHSRFVKKDSHIRRLKLKHWPWTGQNTGIQKACFETELCSSNALSHRVRARHCRAFLALFTRVENTWKKIQAHLEIWARKTFGRFRDQRGIRQLCSENKGTIIARHLTYCPNERKLMEIKSDA